MKNKHLKDQLFPQFITLVEKLPGNFNELLSSSDRLELVLVLHTHDLCGRSCVEEFSAETIDQDAVKIRITLTARTRMFYWEKLYQDGVIIEMIDMNDILRPPFVKESADPAQQPSEENN